MSSNNDTPEGYVLPDVDLTPPEAPKRGRGRPKSDAVKSTAKTPTRKKSRDSEGLSMVLLGLHSAVANMAKIPELELEQDQAQAIAQSLNDVMDYYGTEIPESVAVWLNLGTNLSLIYGSKLLAYRLRVKSEAKKKDGDSKEEHF